MTAVFPDYQNLLIDLDAESTHSSGGGVTSIHIASVDTSQERNGEISVKAHWVLLSHVEFTHVQYHHSERTLCLEPDKVLCNEVDPDNIFLNNNPGLRSE